MNQNPIYFKMVLKQLNLIVCGGLLWKEDFSVCPCFHFLVCYRCWVVLVPAF